MNYLIKIDMIITKTKQFLMIALLSFFTINTFAQGIQFNTGTWNSMLQKAKKENRLIFIDVYTSWCGPCKKMATQTFTQKEVGDFYNTHFICYKVDAEKGEGLTIAKKYQVQAYPNCMFINSKGELVYRFLGAKDVKNVLDEGNKALQHIAILPKMKALSAQYKAGKRDKAFMKEYVGLMLSSGEDPKVALTEYLALLPDNELFTNENVANFKKITTYDKNLFDRFAKHYNNVDTTTQKSLEKPIMNAIGNNLNRMMDGKKEDTEAYEHLISLKNEMKIKDNAVNYIFGGGSAYLPDNELRIIFYSNADENKYRALVKDYMQLNVKMEDVDKIYNQIVEDRRVKVQQIDSLKAIKDSASIKKMQGKEQFSNMIRNLAFGSHARFIVSNAARYWKLSDKSDAVRNDCEKWGLFGYKMCNSLEIASIYADLLVDMNKGDKAKELLTEAIKYAKTDFTNSVTKEDLEKANNKLQSIK
jgi:thiol-disulfide isomerase/thioredoxin